MFNSQKRNNDPEPWRGFSLVRYPSQEGQPNYAAWDPRPEYDNNPNPILVEFRDELRLHREAGEEGSSIRTLAQHWIHTNEMGNETTDAEFVHARKVLERLVNVYSN